MKKINIALMAGGYSSERDISLQSAAQVAASLDRAKYNVVTIDVNGRSWKCDSAEVDKTDFSISIDGKKTIFDYALILIHGSPGEDGKLQGYFDIMGVPYSSCDQVSSVITFDKVTCKRAVAATGVHLAKEIFIRKGEPVDETAIIDKLGLPIFVKPNASGSSFGVTKVIKAQQLQAAIETATEESDDVLIEECITGREMGCGIMITDDKEYLFPITEIVSKKDFFDFEAKYTAGMSDEITPADIDPEMVVALNHMCIKIYKACNCRGIVRIDFIIREADGMPYMIEVNSVPGMSAGSIVPKQAAAVGMSLGDVFDIVIKDTYKK